MTHNNQFNTPWTQEKVDFLIKNYPVKGKLYCANALGMKEHQIRSKASRLNLKARGISEAWLQKNKDHAIKLSGRKRPKQALVMKAVIIDKGLHIHPENVRKKQGEFMKELIKKNGHPKGMLNKKHTNQARQKMSASGLLRAQTESVEIIAQRTEKMIKTKIERGNLVPERIGATWKAGWREIGTASKYYRSAWEANYARYLQFLLEKKQILAWEHEPETFWFDGIKRGVRSYLPDFKVTELNGDVAFHEVKGWMDDKSKTKIKRMGIYHPKVKLIVIDTKTYKDIKKKVSMLIEGWE